METTRRRCIARYGASFSLPMRDGNVYIRLLRFSGAFRFSQPMRDGNEDIKGVSRGKQGF